MFTFTYKIVLNIVLLQNPVIESDKYSESELVLSGGNDPFVVGVPNKAGTHVPTLTSKAFSGTRNPTTQTTFGVYSPVPNAQICRLPYELIRDPRGSSKESIKDMMRKRKKVEFARWPTRAGILRINNTTSKGLYSVNKDDIIQYQIVSERIKKIESLTLDSTQWQNWKQAGKVEYG